MRPHGNRIGSTNGGSAAEPIAPGALTRPSFGNDDDADSLGLRCKSRNKAGAKKWAIEILWSNPETGLVSARFNRSYRTEIGARQAVKAYNRRGFGYSARPLI
jgi:hypothetical protein